MNVLIVESNPIHLDSAESQRAKFAKSGHTIKIIDNLKDAVNFITQRSDEYDVGLFDLWMPRGEWLDDNIIHVLMGFMPSKNDTNRPTEEIYEEKPEDPDQLPIGQSLALKALGQGKKAAIFSGKSIQNDWTGKTLRSVFKSNYNDPQSIIFCELRWFNTLSKTDNTVCAKNWFKAFEILTLGKQNENT
jgi:hypothetical protein